MIYLIPAKIAEDVPRKKYVNLMEIDAPNFWYLHGDLEIQFHYDKAYMFISPDNVSKCCEKIDGRLYLKEGIYTDIVIEGADDKSAAAYMWHRKEGEYTLLRGLVVNSKNEDDVKYATEKYLEKPCVM